MRTHGHHSTGSPDAQAALLMLAGWAPHHRSLEAEVAELNDVQERDAAARTTFQRSAIK